METYKNLKHKLEYANLGSVIKEHEDLRREINYYKKSNLQIKESLEYLKKTKATFDLIFSIFTWLFIISVFSITQVYAQFNPNDVSDLVFFVETSNSSISETHHVATCETDFCLNHSNSEAAVITEQYCDVTGSCNEGCVRRWIDQSNYIENNNGDAPVFYAPEYTNGRNFGQDDSVKPCYITDCVNGKPCIRGGGGVSFATDYTSQDKYLEIQINDFINLSGEFSIFLLAKPVSQTQDWDYFGQSTDYFRHRWENNYLQLRVHPNTVYRVTPNNSVTLNQWQLIEVHRDALNKITVYINGLDKTNVPSISTPDIILPGTFTIGYLFSAFKTNSKIGEEKSMHGDIAGFLVYDKKTSTTENASIRSYFDSNYLGNVLNVKDYVNNKSAIELYPNPASNEVVFKIKKNIIDNLEYSAPEIYNTLGEKLNITFSKIETKEYLKFSIRLKNIEKGFYLINFEGSITKLIKR